MTLEEKKQELSQGPAKEKTPPPPKEEKEAPPSFVERGPTKTSDIRWKILSSKGELYSKYKMTGKEAEEFAKEVGKHGSFLSPQEAFKLKKDLEKTRRTTPDTSPEKKKIEGKLKFLKDNYGL